MEILQAVRVRGERWRVADLHAYDGCQLVTLARGGCTQRILTPFDDVDPIRQSSRPKAVGAPRWREACRALLAADTAPGCLRTAARADIDLLPHQLEPALAVLRGEGSRLLLADDVGLGKTIQAGLVVAELLARGHVERILILTPAGVTDQWSNELQRRFGIVAVCADAASLRRLASSIPLGVNPWHTLPIAVTSIDYFKRLEVLPAVRSARWDVVVLDEAHVAAGDSERRDAVRLVAERAAYVILLTATPHNGNDEAFAALCRIGAISQSGAEPDERLLVFRRTRAAIRGEGSRRIHVLHVRQSTAERHMHDAITRYRRAVAAEHGDRALALSVLEKRALSSPWSLALSVDRRLASIDEPPEIQTLQLALPLADPDGELTADDAPPPWPADLALADVREDRRLLTAIAAAARNAALHDDSKLHRLQRLLRRVRESALVFTEYRDSALHIQAALDVNTLVLHGGMNRQERHAALEAFTRERGRILVATDAAGQGLNLQRTCRLVVNVELPWNPMRLEQRIGRVDRIGQQRRVHAVHLVAADTPEVAILARLKERVARAEATIAAPDPIGGLNRSNADRRTAASVQFARESASAKLEVGRLAQRRAIASTMRRYRMLGEDERPLLLHVRRWQTRAALSGRTLLIYRLTCEDADGHAVESSLVPLLVEGRLADPGTPVVTPDIVAAWGAEVSRAVDAFNATRLVRERAIAADGARSLPLFQPALFDGRAEHVRDDVLREQVGAIHEARARLVSLERRAMIGQPVGRLVLVACP